MNSQPWSYNVLWVVEKLDYGTNACIVSANLQDLDYLIIFHTLRILHKPQTEIARKNMIMWNQTL